jgi:hypothetical protein
MENETMDMIIENVKIDKTIFMETYTRKSGCNYLRSAIVIAKRTRKLFVFIITTRKT